MDNWFLAKKRQQQIKNNLASREVPKGLQTMIFGLGRLFYVTLLLINAVAVLSEERFLSRSMSLLNCNFFHSLKKDLY